MKKIVIALAATVMMTTSALAQDEQQGGQRRQRPNQTEMIQRRTNDMVKQYSLNETQSQQLLELNKKYADKIGTPGRGGRRGPQGRGPQGGPRQQQGGTDAQTGASLQAGQGNGQRPELTEEQKARFETARKEREEAQKAYDTELQQILTEDQYKAYKADMEKRRQRGPRPQNGQN